VENKQERFDALARQRARLQRRIEQLDSISNRYSWTRVAIFFLGIALSIAMFFLVGWWLGLALLLLAALAFTIVAHLQGKIDRSLNRHRLWQHIKATHMARMQLDWQAIPPAYAGKPSNTHPFEIDLDMTGPRSIHQLLNTAISREGSLRLRNWLLATSPNPETIAQRQQLVRELTPMTLFRDKLTLKSSLASRALLEQLEGTRLLSWLNAPPPSSSLVPLMWGSAALSALTVVLLVLALVAHFPDYWLLVLLCNLTLFFRTAKQRGDLFEDAYYLRDAFATLSSIFSYLESYHYGQHDYLKALCAPFFSDSAYRPSSLLRRIARIAAVATLEKNLLLRLLINALLPVEFYAARRLRQYRQQVAAYVPTWLDCWFELEALCSLATFAYLNPSYTLPEVRRNEKEALFTGTALGHPLIPDEKKVTNDFALHALGDVVIITGSNMSGKSTFLRTLGVNLSLAYAGSVVNAHSLRLAPFRLFTCIRVSDSVTDGYSYFYAEVRRLKALLVALEEPGELPLFFLIDEIFKGTNNRERLIGSRSYVRAVAGHRCLGIISTHDLELAKLADTSSYVSNVHFREEVIDGHMVFDYQLRPGPSPTTNALKIMQMEGLPVEQ
jgi:ABC-type multidrug transport system fused ATPase/permease subunit